MTGEPMHTASKERMVPEVMFSSKLVCPNYHLLIEKRTGHYASLSAMFNLLQMNNITILYVWYVCAWGNLCVSTNNVLWKFLW